jgi:hypothetical protein
MIPLSLGQLLLAYAGGTAALIFLVWLAGNFFRGQRESGRRRWIIQCMFCGSLYERPADAALPPCPHCTRPNERTPPPPV